MIEQRPSLNFREKYVVVLMFIIAACFLLLQIVSFISSRAKAVVVEVVGRAEAKAAIAN